MRVDASRLVSLVFVSLVLAAGCECDPVTEAALQITSPADGATITLGDDTNEAAAGLQIEVVGSAIGLAPGDEVSLRVDGSTAGTAFVGGDGSLTWTDVTLTSGSHVLQAVVALGSLESPEVTVNVNADCFAVSIVTPEPGGDSTTLGPADDTDGEMCGATFETTVLAATAAPDGSEARVFVNGTPRRTGRVAGGEDIQRGHTAALFASASISAVPTPTLSESRSPRPPA